MRVLQGLMLVSTFLAAQGALAQQPARFEELSKLDLAFMDEQRALLNNMAAINLGRRFGGERDRDLDLLQTLLDRRLVRPDQTRELQAMGIIMGDLLSDEFNLRWVVLRDNVGRSRALRYLESDFLLFPVTMISRRWEAGDQTPVAEIYRKASDIVTSSPDLPYQ
jgi:hypothetical protein